MRQPTLILILAAGLAAAPALARPFKIAPALPAFPAQPARTDSPAARCAREFLAVINDPSLERVKAFETSWASKERLSRMSPEERVTHLKEMHEDWGKVTVTDFSESKDHFVTVSATAANGPSLEFSFNMASGEPSKLDTIEIQATGDGGGGDHAAALSTELRTQTVQGVADALRKGYVFPDKGAKMADTILAKLRAGQYDDIQGEAALAKQLTDDCRAITHDKHLGIRFAPEEKSASHENTGMPSRDEMRRENYAFEKVEILPGNIGLLRFDLFVEDDEAKRVASNAMNFLSGCDAIIFDIRANGGGSPEMIRYITSYLFDSKTHLNDMVDRDGKVVEEYWTLPEGGVPGPRPKANIPVFVLTSSRTFSGAEEFSYNLKNLKRATLVGETTGGGAHPVRGDRVNDRFIVRVPFMRAQNPITKTNWEGTGVEPDVKTPAADALDKAIELAREAAHAKK